MAVSQPAGSSPQGKAEIWRTRGRRRAVAAGAGAGCSARRAGRGEAGVSLAAGRVGAGRADPDHEVPPLGSEAGRHLRGAAELPDSTGPGRAGHGLSCGCGTGPHRSRRPRPRPAARPVRATPSQANRRARRARACRPPWSARARSGPARRARARRRRQRRRRGPPNRCRRRCAGGRTRPPRPCGIAAQPRWTFPLTRRPARPVQGRGSAAQAWRESRAAGRVSAATPNSFPSGSRRVTA